jgi:hypothetical protein
MVQISFEADFKNFRFSHESFTGVESPPDNQGRLKISHVIDKLEYQIITETEIKVKFHFGLIIAPEVGDYGFDGECILESPEQEKIRHLLQKSPANLKQALNKFLLKECYLYAEKLAHSEDLYFPPVRKILNSYRIS